MENPFVENYPGKIGFCQYIFNKNFVTKCFMSLFFETKLDPHKVPVILKSLKSPIK